MSTTMAGQVVGTPAYLSPARLEGAPALPADDVYALGVVLYEAVTGARLYTGSTPIAIAQTILDAPPQPLAERMPELSPSFAAAVDGAMSRVPAARLTTAAAVRAALDNTALEETSLVGVPVAESTTTMPAVAPMRADRAAAVAAPVAWWQRSSRDVRLAVGALALLAVLLLLVTTRGSKGDPATAVNESVPTTVAPIPTTFAPTPTTQVVVPSARVNVVRPEVKAKGKHGKHGED